MSILASDNIKYQYLYFGANVVSKSGISGLDPLFFYNITRELLINNKRYLEHNRRLQAMADKRNDQINHKLNKYRKHKQVYNLKKEEHYIIKTENDFLNLLSLAEPLDNF